MNVIEIIDALSNLGIYIFVEDGKLKTRADENVLTQDVKNLIRENKNELYEYLSAAFPAEPINHTIITPQLKKSGIPSFAQQSLWLQDQIDGSSVHYNMPAALKLSGTVCLSALQQAFTSIIERHESLRTCFILGKDNQLQQVVQGARAFSIPLIDLSLHSNDQATLQLPQLITEESNRSFDLGRDLMLRAQLIKLAAQEHILLVTMHHIASDGWSMSILINEFSALYSAYVQGHANPLPPLKLQYSDYAYWQRTFLQGETLERLLNYWTTQLADLPVVHSLPLDKDRPALQSFSGNTHYSCIDRGTTTALGALCNTAGATLFMGIHAAFSVLLSHYSNETDIVIGSPIANREQAEIAGLIGFFVNTLVLRSNLSNNPSFNNLLAQSKHMLLDAYAHQQVPFEQIVEQLQPERSLSHNALFQIMLVMQNNEDAELDLCGLTLGVVEQSGFLTAKHDLTLSVRNDARGLKLEWEYNIDLFQATTIARMAMHFELLLQSLVTYPEEPVLKANLLSAEERHQLLMKSSANAAPYPVDKCIHQLFEYQVESHPEEIAVVCEARQLTYGELNRKANQLAHYLINAKQVKPDTLVGICVERSPDMVIALLAILKAGAAYVPLDPNYPAARLAYMMSDAQLTIILTHSSIRDSGRIDNTRALCLDEQGVQQQLQNQSTLNPDRQQTGLNANHLAYVIYTSGSTGNPKGVMVEHGKFAFHIMACRQAYGLTDKERVLQFVSVNFDAAQEQIFCALTTGSKLYLRGNILWTAEEFYQHLIDYKITVADLTPGYCLEVLSSKNPNDSIFTQLKLKTVIVGGEAISNELVRLWRKLPVSWSLINAYGPTEAVITACFHKVTKEDNDNKYTPIGLPFSGRQCYVLRNQLLVPHGHIGELHIGGFALARGYLNRPELTAEKFIKNPFHDHNNPASYERLYNTGDLVRWLPDGNLEFIGRADNQVKIRGFRVEPGEIENSLRVHPQVKDVVLVAKSTGSNDKRLIAYIATEAVNPTSDNEAGLQEYQFSEILRTHLSQTLPDYMIPSSFVLLDKLPLTVNGKVDRKSLPEPDMSAQDSCYIAPRTETEKMLCDIWRDVLSLDRVSVNDNFFDIGGHSLLVIQVISHLQLRGYTISAREFFITPKLVNLASALDKTTAASFKAPPNLIPDNCEHITPDMLPLIKLRSEELALIAERIPGGFHNIQDIYPLAPLQEGILFHHKMNTYSDPYVMPLLLKVKGLAAVHELIDALQFIINRHDVLRTAIMWRELSAPVQVVCRHANLPVNWLELDREQDVEIEIRTRFEQQWMDLSQAPLLQLQIAGDYKTQHYWILVQNHHIVLDHVSLDIIRKEMAIYRAGKAASLATPVFYREFIAHVQHQAQHTTAKTFFSQTLGDIDEPTAPFNLLDIRGDGSKISTITAAVPSAISASIRDLASNMMISPAAIFHTAWAMVISACSNRDDVVFGTVLSGRLQGTLSTGSMLGMFINCLPLRVKINNTNTIDVVRQVYESLLNLLAYEQTSLVLAQSCSGLPAGSPLFTALLNYRHSEVIPDEPENTSNENADVEFIADRERTNYPFSLSVDDDGKGFALDLQVDNSIAGERVINYVQTAIARLVDALQSAPYSAINTVSILPEVERHQLLVEWNNTTVDYPRTTCIHELFEAQVQKTPDAVALIYEDRQLTYAQLNSRANQLAHYLLHTQQIKPDSLVGLCVERSLEMVIGILGILKAGGAYVPLDPDYPVARLSYMLEDTGLTTLLTQSHLAGRLVDGKGSNSIRLLCLDDTTLQSALSTCAQDNPDPQQLSLSHHLAYVIYTSGSTGNPKGVMIAHRNTVAFLCWAKAIYTSSQLECVLAATSICFDLSVFEIFAPLISGGSVYVVKNILALQFTNDKPAISLINTVPSAIDSLLSGKGIPQSVNTINLAGEPLQQRLVDNLYAAGLHAVYDLYGPSEDTTYSTFVLRQPKGVASIGKPIHNCQVYVLTPTQHLAISGVPGELYIGGAGLARGYLNRPELTAEKFIANPFHNPADPASSPRLYKTGDLVRWRADGQLEFLGRIDHQVKIRGFRIELGEIEAALCSHIQVREALVTARDYGDGDKRLVGYVVGKDEEAIAAMNSAAFTDSLRQHLGQTLPEHMIPSAFVVVPQWPLTANGKVDRNALPEADMTAVQDYVAPRTPTEEILCGIWQEVLGVERVGVTDNFFMLGGHSLLVIHIIQRLLERGLSMDAQQIFKYQTIAELAININTHISNNIGGIVVYNDYIPLLPAQHRFFDSLPENPHLFNAASIFEVLVDLDINILQQSIEKLLKMRDELRLAFVHTPHGWKQRILIELPENPFKIYDFSTLSKEEQDENIIKVGKKLQVSLNIFSGVLVRFCLFILGPNRPPQFLYVFHHLIVDDVSIGNIFNNLLQYYNQLKGGDKPSFFIPKFAEVIAQLETVSSSPGIIDELAFWESQFKTDIKALPVDYEVPRKKNNFGSIHFAMGGELGKLETKIIMEEMIINEKMSAAAVILYAMSLTIAKWNNGSSMLIDLMQHGREVQGGIINLSEVLGWHAVTIPFLVDPDATVSYIDNIHSISQRLQHIPYSGTHFGLLKYMCADNDIKEKLKNKPHPQIMLNYVSRSTKGGHEETYFKMLHTTFDPYVDPDNNFGYNLSFLAGVNNGILGIGIRYSVNLYKEETINTIMHGCIKELDFIAKKYSSEKKVILHNHLKNNLANTEL